jgi:hypothetical protein
MHEDDTSELQEVARILKDLGVSKQVCCDAKFCSVHLAHYLGSLSLYL